MIAGGSGADKSAFQGLISSSSLSEIESLNSGKRKQRLFRFDASTHAISMNTYLREKRQESGQAHHAYFSAVPVCKTSGTARVFVSKIYQFHSSEYHKNLSTTNELH